MLSEETAIGRYPVEAVTMMAAIAGDAESIAPFAALVGPSETTASPADAVGRAACILADDIAAAAIVTCTESGTTARRVARYRPRAPILAPTPHAETYRRLALVWGVTPITLADTSPAALGPQLLARGLLATGAVIVIVSMRATLDREGGNFLQVERVG